ASGPGSDTPSCPSSQRTTYGGAPSSPRASRIAPSRRGEPALLLSATRWSPTLACIADTFLRIVSTCSSHHRPDDARRQPHVARPTTGRIELVCTWRDPLLTSHRLPAAPAGHERRAAATRAAAWPRHRRTPRTP